MGTPAVKWVWLFLKYLHPWSPVFMRDPLSGWRQEDLCQTCMLSLRSRYGVQAIFEIINVC